MKSLHPKFAFKKTVLGTFLVTVLLSTLTPVFTAHAAHGSFCFELDYLPCVEKINTKITECTTLPATEVTPCIELWTVMLAHANEPVTDPDDPGDSPTTDPDAPPGSVTNFTWDNPSQFGTFEEIVVGILDILVVVMIPIIVLMIIYAGFLYVTARGNAEQIKKATTALTYAVIGALLIIGAAALAGILRETLCEFRPDGSPGCPAGTSTLHQPLDLTTHV